MGRGEHPACNPPPLGEADIIAWRFYADYATGFVKDFAIMPKLIEEMGLDDKARRALIQKLSLIHSTLTEKAMREAERKARNG